MVFAGTVVTAVAAGPGAEVDPSMGTVQGTVKATPTQCAAEDGGGPYVLLNEKLKGTSTDALDGSGTPGDFSLTGALTSTAKITVNLGTGQGWGTGVITVTNAANTITGPVTFVFQLDPSGNPHARGLWVGTVKDSTGAATGDLSVQN